MAPPLYAFPLMLEHARAVAKEYENADAAVYRPLGRPFGAVVTRDGKTIEELSGRFSGSEYPADKFEIV